MMRLFTIFFLVCGVIVFANEKDNHFVDPRDGQRYPAVKIGDQIWMGRDLSFQLSGSYCFDDKNNCPPNGRLYPWVIAIEVCPDGWHLPTDLEWQKLENYLGCRKTIYQLNNFEALIKGRNCESAEAVALTLLSPDIGVRMEAMRVMARDQRIGYLLLLMKELPGIATFVRMRIVFIEALFQKNTP